jgi:HSP20 family protein
MAQLPARRSGRNLVLVDPSREFEDIYNRMGQLMNMAFADIATPMLADMPWAPMADLSETDNAYVVHAELPGVQRDQIDVELQDRELLISGEIQPAQNGHTHRSSRRTGRFEYRTMLPGDVQAGSVNAQLSNGVLTVTIPKSETAKPRKIEVKGA